MNISSTPFIRNDYWPDYNDINILNQRIDEAENEISLVNIRLTTDIENVSNNLNSYKKNMADAVITNNIIVNNLNANYAIGKYANFINTNTDNAYIENLTVNKPVFDLTLNTPHVENITSIGGNFYEPNLFNVAVDNLFLNTQLKPVNSSAVLGYDSKGRVIPVKATFNVGFPENADYLFTDHVGTARAGTAATEVGISSNLITAHAVKNAIDNVNNSFKAVNTFINNGFNNINNSFNKVNKFVNNGFNNVNNSFNAVNKFVNNGFNNINNSFNDVANELNEAYNTINSLQDKIRILSVDDANYYWSGAPVNYQNVTRITFNHQSKAGTQISGKRYPVNMLFNSTSNTLEFYSKGFSLNDFTLDIEPTPIELFNSDISNLFEGCTNLNYSAGPREFNFNFCEPAGNFITNMAHTFDNCHAFNQPVQIPDSVTDMRRTFYLCRNFNQNILIPNSVTSLSGTFHACKNLNQNILIPNSATNISYIFFQCENFDQNILIPNSVTNMDASFAYSNKFNQNILIPNSVTSLSGVFQNCISLDQNILIHNSVTNLRSAFAGCNNLNQNILIPNSVTYLGFTFDGCNNLNQSDMYIYSQNIEIDGMRSAFNGCHINNIHIPTSVPKSTSNFMYNCLVNGNTGITFPASNIFNDLPVDIKQWPPV